MCIIIIAYFQKFYYMVLFIMPVKKETYLATVQKKDQLKKIKKFREK